MILNAIVKNGTEICLGGQPDGILPSNLNSSQYSLQDYDYVNPEEQAVLIAYEESITAEDSNIRFIDGQVTYI